MTAINYEYAGGYLSHSDPVSRILLYEDVSSPTSSMICLVDSPLSNAGSLSCHTFNTYNPKCETGSDISLSSDYVTRSAVDRVRNNLRRCAVSIECGQKTPSVGKVAQELLDECLKEDLYSSRPSPVYPKRKSKASTISTSSVAIDDTDLFCVSENSDQCCSCSKKSELIGDGNKPAGSNVPPSNNTTTPDNCRAEASTSQEPRRAASVLKNPARPCHVHCRSHRRRCHPHSWTTIKKPGLGETLATKFHKFLDSGARLAGYYPYNCTKCECKRSDTLISIKQAEKAAPTPPIPIPQVSSTQPDAGLELTCSGQFCTPKIVPIKNPSQCTRESKCSFPGVLNSNSKTRQTPEFGAEAVNPQGTLVQRGCCDKYIAESTICPDCIVKTLDLLSSAAETLNSKGSCESHSKSSTQSKHRKSKSRKTSQDSLKMSCGSCVDCSPQSKHRKSKSRKSSLESLKVICECRAKSPTRSKHRISKQKASQESLKMSCGSCVECSSPHSIRQTSKSHKRSQENLKVSCECRAKSPTHSKHQTSKSKKTSQESLKMSYESCVECSPQSKHLESKSRKTSQESLKMSCGSCVECSPQSKHLESKSRKTSQESLKMSCGSCVECSSPHSIRQTSKTHKRSQENLKVSCECRAKSPTHSKHQTSKSKKTSQESLKMSYESCVECSPQSKHLESKSRKTSQESLKMSCGSCVECSSPHSIRQTSKSHKKSQENLKVSCECRAKSPTHSKHQTSKSKKTSQESLKMSYESCVECSPQSKHLESKSRKTSQESLKMSCGSCVECSSPHSIRQTSKSHKKSQENLKVSCECRAKSPTHSKHQTSKSKKTSQESLNISCKSCAKCYLQSKRRTSKSRKTSKESLTRSCDNYDKIPTQSKHRKSKSHKTCQESLLISCDCHGKSPTQSKHGKSKSHTTSQERLIISCDCHGKSPTHLKNQIAEPKKTSQESFKNKIPTHFKDRVSKTLKSSLESLKNTKSESRIAVTPPRAEPLTPPKPEKCELCVSTTKCSGGCGPNTPEPEIQTPELQVTGPEHVKTNKSESPTSAAQPEAKTGPEKNKVESPVHSKSTASISGAKSPEPIPKTITPTTCPGPAICKRRSKTFPSTCSTTPHSLSADSAAKSRTQSPGQSNATEPDLPTSEASNTSNRRANNKKNKTSKQSKKQSTGTGPETPKTEQRPLSKKQSTDLEQVKSFGTQTDKSNLSRSDAIRSGPALYKISGIKLQLVGFSESNAAVLHIHNNLTGEGFEANPSKPGDVVPQNTCCPCPRSARSLAASNVQQRNAGTECECTPQQKTNANTSIGAAINTCARTPQERTNANTSIGAEINTCARTPQERTNASTSIGAEINRPTPDTQGDTKLNQPALPSSIEECKISKNSLDTGQQESLDSAPNVATTKRGSTSSVQVPLNKDGSKERAKSKKSGDKYGTGTVAEFKKGGLTSCWPFSMCFKPKKEASVGDEYTPRDDKAVNVSTNEGPISNQYYCETRRCETNHPLANTQGLPVVSSQSFCPNMSHPNENRSMFLNACAKLGNTCQSHTSNSASMISSVNTSHINGSHVKNNPSTSMLNSRNRSPFQDSQFHNSQAVSMTSSPNPSPGLMKNPATSILSDTNICCTFQGLEIKNRFAPASGCPNPTCLNPGCPFQITKTCRDRCCSFQNSEINKGPPASIKCCPNSACPFKDSLMINHNIPDICCNFGDLSTKKQLAGPCCPNSITNEGQNTTDCDKDSLTNQKTFQSSKDMKSSSKDSMAKEKVNLSSPNAVRCETTQYSSTYVNDGPKEVVPVKRSLSQPIWCDCGAKPIRSSGSAPSVDQPGSQQHPTSVLNPKLDTSSFCIYCGQATLLLENRGPIDKSQGPLPSAACQDTTCPNKQRSMPSYLHAELAQPVAPAKNLAKKGSSVECMCAEFADQYNTKQIQAEHAKEYARGFMVDRQSGASGLQFSMIPRDPIRGNYMTQQGDTETSEGGPQQSNTHVECGDSKCPGYPKNSVSCECSLVASLQQFCQPNACPGRDYCLGPASKQNQTEFPCGDICAQKVSSLGSSVKASNKKVKPAKLQELTCGDTCLKQLTARSSESISETPRSGSAKPAKQPKQLKVKGLPCVSICSIEPIKSSKKAIKAKTEIPCDNIRLQKARRHGAGLIVSMSGSCSCSEQPAKLSKQKKIEFSCGNVCLQKLTYSTSSSRETISRSASIISPARVKPRKKAKKSKSPKASDLPFGNVCLEKLGSSSSSPSSPKQSTTKAAKPAKPLKHPKATGPCGSVDCIKVSKKSKQAKSSKKSKTPKASDFTGNTLELGSSASSSAIYITSKLMSPTPSHSGKPPKAVKKPKLPKAAKFPCGNICFKKLKSISNASRSAKRAKESAFSCNSICLQVTPCGSPLHSASSKSNSRIKIANQAEPAKPPKSAKQPIEACFEKLTPCGSTSSSAISKISSKSNSEEPDKPTKLETADKQTKPQKADIQCEEICLRKLSSSSSARSSFSTEKTVKPPNVSVFPCNSMCLQVSPCGSAYNSKNNSKTKVGKKANSTKQPKIGDFPCGEICLQKLTASSSPSSFKKSKSSSKTPEAIQPKAAYFPCGNICLQKQTSTSSVKSAGKSSKPAKPPILPKSVKQPKDSDQSEILTPSGSASSLAKSKSSSTISKTEIPAKSQKAGKRSKLLKAADFPCGDICSQKLTSSSSASSSAKSINSIKSAAKPAKAPKSAKQPQAADFPSGSASSLAESKTSNETKVKSTKRTKQSKSGKQPKATDFPCENICMQKLTTSSSASSSATSKSSSKTKPKKPSKQPKAADFPCGNICMQKLTSSSRKTKPAKPPKSAKQQNSSDFPCGNICLQKLNPSNNESSSAKSSKTKVAKRGKSAQSPKNNVETSTSIIFSAMNKEIPPCENAFSQTPPSASAAKLKNAIPPKPPKPAKAGKGAKCSCTCPPTLTKSPKSSKTKAAKPTCVCPPTVKSCASALSVAKSAIKGKPPKAVKGAKGQPTITPCGSASSLTKTNKPPKSPKAGKRSKSPCVCPPTITPCGSGSSLTKATKSSKTKAAKPPKSPKAGKRAKSPCVCPPTLTPCGSGSSLTKITKPPKSPKAGKRAKSPPITPSGSALNVAKSEKRSKSPNALKGAKGQPTIAITPCGSVTSLTKTTKLPKSPKTVKITKSSCSCPPTLTPCGSALDVAKKSKPPKSPKAKKGGKSPCVCPPTITPCESTRSLGKSAKPPKSVKGEITPPSSLTPCGSETSSKPTKSPKSPKAKKGAISPCLCPPTLSPCGSAQLAPSGPRTPVKLVKPNSYKGNQEGVISLEQYEKNKKKKKKTKLQNTDVCLPICEASCNDKNNKNQLPVIECVAGSKSLKGVIVTCECPTSEPKKSKKRDKWFGIFPCNRQCESPKSVVPCQCPASGFTTPKNTNIANQPSDPKGGKRYIDCSLSYDNGKPKSLRSVVPCECPATERKSKSKLKKTFIECSLSSLCQLSKSKRKAMTCECHEAAPKKKGRKVGTSGPVTNQRSRDPRSPGEDPANQGIKVEIRKKVCPLFANA